MMHFLAIAVLSGAFASNQPAPDKNLSDTDITDVVERELLHDRAVSSRLVDVKTSDGIVTLTGEVDNLLAKERAARVAETVKGVRAVIDRIMVREADDRTDEDIQRDVEAMLLFDAATDSYEIGVSVDDGTVTLTGTVESWAERELCEQVAKGVRGVRSLDDQIDVVRGRDRPDSEIVAEIQESLRWDALVDHALIRVEVKDGKVTLSGIVGSAAEKRQARSDAWTAGVKSVDDSDLQVARWARDEDLRKRKYSPKPDSEIKSAVEDAMLQDPRVNSFKVDTSVNGGLVTLRGVVDNLKAKRAAEQDASETVGVLSVQNHLKVRSRETDDDEIEARVRDALLRDPYVDRYQISVTVDDGIAYLYGTVDSYFEKGQADDVASRINGVVDVVNGLTVHDEPFAYDPYVDDWNVYRYGWYDYVPSHTFKSDWEIERDTRDELFWSPFVDADDVHVEVDDGIVTLTGTVDSWSEMRAARNNAYESGAIYVRNDLKVKSSGASEASSKR